MSSLHRLIGDLQPVPSPQERAELALIPAKALLMLHLSYWYHKIIRSHNVTFFATEISSVKFNQPYLIGFEFSRANVGDAVKEIPGASNEFNLYRHPDRQGLPVRPVDNTQGTRPPYSKKFDIYSLGVVLLEIGLWRRLVSVRAEATKDADYGADTAPRFREWALNHIVPKLEANMGPVYMEVVRDCLAGDLFEGEDGAVAALYTNVVGQLE